MANLPDRRLDLLHDPMRWFGTFFNTVARGTEPACALHRQTDPS